MENNISENGYVNGNGKVHLKITLDLASCPIKYDFNRFYFTEILKLLLNVYEGIIQIPELKVNSIFSNWFSGYQNMPQNMNNEGLLDTIAEGAYTDFEFRNTRYIGRFLIEKDKLQNFHYYMDFSYPKESIPEAKIGHELLRLAFSYTSSYKKGCVEISFMGEREVISNLEVTKIDAPKSDLDKIYINDNIKEDIQRFVYTFQNFDKLQCPLRFLLSGKPGLGKTEVVRSIIEKCSEYGNVIIPKNMDGTEWLSFEFAKLFNPSVICIDDIDLLFGKREEGYARKTLGKFLNALDGILENKVFVIATTNDKHLVDIAASRPGRFDEIIDFGDFERRFYMDLIRQRTDDEKIISLFNEEVLDYMDSKKVTGAFIVNLVKQLKIMTKINHKFSNDDLMQYLQRNYKGFYKSQLKEEKTFGFGG